MKHLYLLRHAASASEAMAEDFDVPLSALGRKQAKAMSAYMRAQAIRPQLILCSAAVRAQQTCEMIAPEMAPDVRLSVDGRLYLASAAGLLERVRDTAETVGNLLVVGHNPGMQQLAALLAGEAGDPARPHAQVTMPPCALAAFAVPMTRWRELGAGDAHLIRLILPGDLGV